MSCFYYNINVPPYPCHPNVSIPLPPPPAPFRPVYHYQSMSCRPPQSHRHQEGRQQQQQQQRGKRPLSDYHTSQFSSCRPAKTVKVESEQQQRQLQEVSRQDSLEETLQRLQDSLSRDQRQFKEFLSLNEQQEAATTKISKKESSSSSSSSSSEKGAAHPKPLTPPDTPSPPPPPPSSPPEVTSRVPTETRLSWCHNKPYSQGAGEKEEVEKRESAEKWGSLDFRIMPDTTGLPAGGAARRWREFRASPAFRSGTDYSAGNKPEPLGTWNKERHRPNCTLTRHEMGKMEFRSCRRQWRERKARLPSRDEFVPQRRVTNMWRRQVELSKRYTMEFLDRKTDETLEAVRTTDDDAVVGEEEKTAAASSGRGWYQKDWRD